MVLALADCNNFYVSCERVFNPKLRNRPVVVLSNNDGCVISRSAEAKTAGITMGMPLFKAKSIIQAHGVAVLSSNYALYGHMSRRVMDIMAGFPVQREVYSIDEAFLKLPDESSDKLTDLCVQMRHRILRWTDIPVSIGIAETKTLAKIANHLVKRSESNQDVINLLDTELKEDSLKTFPVGSVWGVGRNIRQTLQREGLQTAADLRDADTFWIQRQFGVKGLALVLELRGQVCNDINATQSSRREIIVSRSFAQRLSGYDRLAGAFAEFARKGAERLRTAGMATRRITVYVVMDRYRPDYQGGSSIELELETASDKVDDLIHFVREGLRQVLVEGREYKKGGIILGNLTPVHVVQDTLFTGMGMDADKSKKPASLIEAIEAINMKYKSAMVLVHSDEGWRQRQNYMSPRYVTRWSDIPLAR